MRVFNLNEVIRKYISNLCINKLKEDSFENEEKLENFYNDIISNPETFKYIVGLILEIVYLDCCDSLKYESDNKELLLDKEFIESIDSVELFIEYMDFDMFEDYCFTVANFNDKDFQIKAIVIEEGLENKKTLMNIFPGYAFDLLYYIGNFDSTIILEEYKACIKEDGELDAMVNTIFGYVNKLEILRKYDFETYKYVILDIIEGYYKYYKYLDALNNSNGEFNYEHDIVTDIENDLVNVINRTFNDLILIDKIVEGYLKSLLLSKEELEKINNYYKDADNKKELVKVIKKSNELKKSK